MSAFLSAELDSDHLLRQIELGYYDSQPRNKPSLGPRISFLSRLAVFAGVAVLVGQSAYSGEQEPFTATTVLVAASSPTPDDVKAKAQSIAYESLAREPNKYVGTTVTFVGKVIQVQESGRSATAHQFVDNRFHRQSLQLRDAQTHATPGYSRARTKSASSDVRCFCHRASSARNSLSSAERAPSITWILVS